jgi:hypothetical protein
MPAPFLKCPFLKSDIIIKLCVFPVIGVITAWVTLLYVVGLAIALAATSIGRIGLVRRGLGRAATSALGQKRTSETHANNVRFTPESGLETAQA